MIIGITGSSGSGKSTISKILAQKYNAKIIDADEIARRLSMENSKYINEIVSKFGKDIVDEAGNLNRKQLAEIIYSDENKREVLNNCTFKYIVSEIKTEIQNTINRDFIIIDAPLLFESKLNEVCDMVIGVITKRKIQIDRIMKRDNINLEHAEKRIESQKNNDFYIQNCDKTIENDGDINFVKKKIEKLEF